MDVNVGLPDIDEVAMMREVIQKLQAVTSLPSADRYGRRGGYGTGHAYLQRKAYGQFCQRKTGIYGYGISSGQTLRRRGGRIDVG